ncbi:MAG: hypothetical protein H6671_17605 [Anaerolineaceae bacterium]|nr:hypothetical protein [Anaerolineaceae bacterium]
MPLEKCNHMAALCPHKDSNCDAEGASCHYVVTATTSALRTYASLLKVETRLTPEQKIMMETILKFLKQSKVEIPNDWNPLNPFSGINDPSSGFPG